MMTVHAQCGCRSAGVRGGRWMGRTCARALVATAVASKVGSSMVWHIPNTYSLAHRLHVEQGAAVVEVEFAVPAVVDGVAEIHELRWSADVELQALEDRRHVVALVVQRPLHASGVDRAGARPLLDGDLHHLVAAERADAPGHAGAVDHLPDQQQFGNQDGQLLAGQLRVSGLAHRPKIDSTML